MFQGSLLQVDVCHHKIYKYDFKTNSNYFERIVRQRVDLVLAGNLCPRSQQVIVGTNIVIHRL